MRLSFAPRIALLSAAFAAVSGCQEDAPAKGAITVPSGREIALIDVITNAPGNAGAVARFRFLAPGLTPDDIDGSAGDMQALCDGYALPKTLGTVPEPQQIIISLSAVAVPFGTPAPDVVQFFEAYRVVDGACVPEPF